MSHTRTAKDEPTRKPPMIVVRRICNARSRGRVSLGKRGEARGQARTGDVAFWEKDDRMLSVTAIKMIVKRLPTDARSENNSISALKVTFAVTRRWEKGGRTDDWTPEREQDHEGSVVNHPQTRTEADGKRQARRRPFVRSPLRKRPRRLKDLQAGEVEDEKEWEEENDVADT